MNIKNIDTSISQARKKLIAKANKKGIYEDFGQKEYNNLCDTYSAYENGNHAKLSDFFNWCINYTGA
jgi:hypothetical protein